MRFAKKALSILLAAVICLTLGLYFPAQAFAEEETGSCGAGATWKFNDATGAFTISGSGKMTAYSSATAAEWSPYRSVIKSAVVTGVSNLGDYALYSCAQLSDVSLGSSVKTIGANAVLGAPIRNISLGNISSIEAYAFSECDKLQSVSIASADGGCTIASRAFSGCDELKTAYIYGKSTIGESSFQDCKALQTVTLYDGVSSIGKNAFKNCAELSSVTIPSSVTSIDASAFTDCDKLNVICSGSYAENYCKTNKIRYTLADSTTTSTDTNTSSSTSSTSSTTGTGSGSSTTATGTTTTTTAAAVSNTGYVTVNSTELRVRKAATAKDSKNVVTTVKKDEVYAYTERVVNDEDTWYYITAANNVKGWVMGVYCTATAKLPVASTGWLIINTNLLNVRKTAGATSANSIVTEVKKDAGYEYTDATVSGGAYWYKITVNGEEGWVVGTYVKRSDTKPTGTGTGTEDKSDGAIGKLTVEGTNINTRKGAGTSYAVAGKVENGAEHEYYETSQSGSVIWYKIKLDDEFCWISGQYCSAEKYEAETVRLGGSTRIETAVKVSSEGWAAGDTNTAILAYALNYPDALAGVPLAGALNAPILLTANNSTLESSVMVELMRLGVTNVYILGGSSVIGSGIETELKNAGCTVKRLAGSNRYATAVEIAKELAGLASKKAETLFFVSGENFPDALSVSTVASISGSPILYLPASGSIDSATKTYINSLDADKACLVGGTSAVAELGKQNLEAANLTVERVSGADRYETSYQVLAKYKSLFNTEAMTIATGTAFPDALTGGALAAKLKLPVVLAPAATSGVNTNTVNFITGQNPGKIYIFGGTSVLSDAVINKLIGSEKALGSVIISGTGIALRSAAGSDNAQVGKVGIGETFEYFGTEAKGDVTWYNVKYSGQSVWVSGEFAIPFKEVDEHSLTVDFEPLNVRKAPASGATILTTVKKGSYQCDAYAVNGSSYWFRISVSGVMGWVMGDYVTNSHVATTTTTTTTKATTTTKKYTSADIKGYVTITSTTNVNIRIGAGTGYTKLLNKNGGAAYAGSQDVYAYVGQETVGGVVWYHILVGSKEGWISGTFCTATTQTKTTTARKDV